MYIGYRKPYRKPISLGNEIDLLLHFPFGGLIGWRSLSLDHTYEGAHQMSVKVKSVGRNRNIKHNYDTKNLDIYYNYPNLM